MLQHDLRRAIVIASEALRSRSARASRGRVALDRFAKRRAMTICDRWLK
jgi:hypothetical protein